MVEERREGRRHYYSLVDAGLARWIVDGLDVLAGHGVNVDRAKIRAARRLWAGE